MKYVFGPLKSRRLGNSLGINLLSGRVCSFNCIYCQLGPTTQRTVKKFKFDDTKRLFIELVEAVKGERVDFITLSGSGEPTLISNLGEIIKEIKRISSVPVAVITNSSLMFDVEVRRALCQADVILPSLDAAQELEFRLINQAHPSIKLCDIIGGLITFRKLFKGEIWLEIMLLRQIKINKKHLDKFKEIITKIKPDKIHLVSPVRTINKYISTKDKRSLLLIKKALGKNCFII